MITVLTIGLILASMGLEASAFLSGSYTWLAIGGVLTNSIWMTAIMLRWKWLTLPCVFANYALVAAGLLLDLNTLVLSGACLTSLLAWDLTDLLIRLRLASPQDDTRPLVKRHLARLSLIACISVALILLVQWVRLGFAFEWMLVLLVFAVWGLGRLIRGLLTRKT